MTSPRERKVEKLELFVSPQVHAILLAMVRTGLWGFTVEQCAEELLREEARKGLHWLDQVLDPKKNRRK